MQSGMVEAATARMAGAATRQRAGRPGRRLPAAERREVIERAAERLFADLGYEATSLDQVADASGISKRVIYDHFESKQHLHAELIRAQSARLWEFVLDWVASADTVELRVRAGVEAVLIFVERHPFAWRMMYRDPPTEPEAQELHRTLHARFTDGLAALLASDPATTDAVAAAQPVTMHMLAELLKSTVAGVVAWWYEHRDVPREDVVAGVMGFAWLGLERLGEGGRWRDPREGAR